MENEDRLSNFGGARAHSGREPLAGDDAEIGELLGLAQSLVPRTAEYRNALDRLIETTKAVLVRSATQITRESLAKALIRFGKTQEEGRTNDEYFRIAD